MSVSAIIIVNNHGKEQYYYCHQECAEHQLGLKLCSLFLNEECMYDGSVGMWKEDFEPKLKSEYFSLKTFPQSEHIAFVYTLDVTEEEIVISLYKRPNNAKKFKHWEKWNYKKLFHTEIFPSYCHELLLLNICYS